METTKYKVGGYRFDDYSDLIELYIPTNVAMNPARTLHVRGREALEHHLQHYFVPYGKVFLGLRATAQLTTDEGIGLLGTHFRWRKGYTKEWAINTFYYIGNDVVHYDGIVYSCKTTHTSTDTFDPTKWNTHDETYVEAWQDNHFYYRNEFVTREFVYNGLTIQAGYRVWNDHLSESAVNEPVVGSEWETWWDIGDEMQADLSWPYYYYGGNPGFVPTINLSEGHKYQFGSDVIGKFRAWHFWPETNHEGRALDALCTTGYMKQNGVLWGVEIDDEEYYHED